VSAHLPIPARRRESSTTVPFFGETDPGDRSHKKIGKWPDDNSRNCNQIPRWQLQYGEEK
jgi:hypothetical protein